eukprot:GHVR01076321.1.p1 GENE.GHVR01076321.1~~GHVR01076321.1.p1  ORF type:complete len:459 (+),score=87.12 GHVR01076321.1:42-1418(+)
MFGTATMFGASLYILSLVHCKDRSFEEELSDLLVGRDIPLESNVFNTFQLNFLQKGHKCVFDIGSTRTMIKKDNLNGKLDKTFKDCTKLNENFMYAYESSTYTFKDASNEASIENSCVNYKCGKVDVTVYDSNKLVLESSKHDKSRGYFDCKIGIQVVDNFFRDKVFTYANKNSTITLKILPYKTFKTEIETKEKKDKKDKKKFNIKKLIINTNDKWSYNTETAEATTAVREPYVLASVSWDVSMQDTMITEKALETIIESSYKSCVSKSGFVFGEVIKSVKEGRRMSTKLGDGNQLDQLKNCSDQITNNPVITVKNKYSLANRLIAITPVPVYIQIINDGISDVTSGDYNNSNPWNVRILPSEYINDVEEFIFGSKVFLNSLLDDEGLFFYNYSTYSMIRGRYSCKVVYNGGGNNDSGSSDGGSSYGGSNDGGSNDGGSNDGGDNDDEDGEEESTQL